jgi:uncharacterized protein YciI
VWPLITAHQPDLARSFTEGGILASGPEAGSGGCAIVMPMASLEAVEAYLAADPMRVAGVQNYRPVGLRLHDGQPAVRERFH